MRVLIIGGTRFVGYLLAFRLIARGDHVTLLNRGSTPDPFGDRIERIVVDRKSPEFEEAIAGHTFDAVIDFAAYEEDDARRAAAALGGGRAGHYVFISTGQVYLVREGCPKPAKESDYDGPLIPRPRGEDEPQWDYGAGKRRCEDALIEAFAEKRFPATSIRIPIVNGERDYARRLDNYFYRILDGGPVILPDGGQHPVRHVYGSEVARFIAGMLGDARTFGQAYNVCQSETPTLAELLTMVAQELGAEPRFVAVPSAEIARRGLSIRDVSPFSGRWMSMLDPAKVVSELGFVHEPLERYLGKIIASFIAHPPPTAPEEYRRRRDEIALANAAIERAPR